MTKGTVQELERPPQTETQGEGNGAAVEKAYLLHAVWFHPEHGAKRFREYLELASPIAEKYGARRVDALLPIEAIRGRFDPDYVSVVEWPSIDRYYDFLKDLHYRSVAALREEAIAKSVILRCRRV